MFLAGRIAVLLLHGTADTVAEEVLPGRVRAAGQLIPRGLRAAGRRTAFLRRSVLRKPLVSDLSDRRYEARRARHAHYLPEVPAAERAILAELGDAGVAVRPAALPAEVVASTDRFVELLRGKHVDEPCVKATPRELANDPALFAWGLSDHLLDMAECHIGLPVRYLGVEVKREMVESAEGRSHEVVRRWHLDHEDRRIFKVIVYLSDVDAGAGPFGFVHQSNSGAILESTHGRSLHGVSDEKMQTVVPQKEWRQVTGPRMTAIHVDTGQVFHRVFPPTNSERYSVTFAYSSRTPYYTYSRLMLPRRAVRQLRQQLSQRQWDCLCMGRGRRPDVG
jgi:hypothetical protein